MPSTAPQSCTFTMLGWLIPAAARASRRNRSTNPASPARDRCRTLIATSRSRTASRARNTSPIPPAAIRSRMWYRPSSVVRRRPPSAAGPAACCVILLDVAVPPVGEARSQAARARGPRARPAPILRSMEARMAEAPLVRDQDLGAELDRIERAVDAGATDLGELGFWRVVKRVKLSPLALQRYGDQIGRIDTEAFRRGVPRRYPVWLGNAVL